jgi:cobalt-zinc-cadmium efflux system outer membrane protein
MRLHLAPLLAVALAMPALFSHAAESAAATTPSRTLTLRDALDSAMAHNPELTSARRELEAAEGARQQSSAYPNPTIGLDVEDTRRATRSTTVLLSQPIELGGKRAARISAADRSRDLAVAQFEAQAAQVRAAVTTAYFDALVAQERIRLAESSLSLAGGASDAAAKRVIAGKISPVDETRARVAESGVRLELLQARSEQRSALHALRAATGAPQGAYDAVSGAALALPVSMPEAELARRLATAPAIRQARRDTERFAALAEVERARGTPDLTVSVGAKRDAEAGRNMAVLGVSMPIPVFDSNRGAQVEALRRVDKAVADARAVAVRVETDALQAHERMRTAHAEVESLQRDVLPGAQGAYDAAVKGFDLGKFGFLDVLDAQRTLLAAKGQYLRALAETHRSRIELDRLLGASEQTPPADAPAQH